MIPDTNVLVRLAVEDDLAQTARARQAMRDADTIHLSNTVICEFVWAIRRIYRYSKADIISAIKTLTSDHRVVCDRGAIDSGLEFLSLGSDFADGVIAFEGRRVGGSRFVTFDRRAATVAKATGQDCLLLDGEMSG